MLPGIGAGEYILIAVAALVVIGPKDLPLVMRKLGQFVNRLRQMAGEFRASFDEMARQSELDELRKQVEELRSGRLIDPITADIAPAMTEIESDLRAYPAPDMGPPPAEEPDRPAPEPKPVKPRASRAARPKASPAGSKAAKPAKASSAKAPPAAKTGARTAKPAAAKPAPKASTRTAGAPARSRKAKAP